tara:strand:+ start:628 stop:1866 length:1239 start_codon:yes stop_codon:yes gene_type:complete
MANIPKTGIVNASTIRAEHLTRIIDSLDGTGLYDISATGSFTGSFDGDGNLTGSYTGSFSGDGTNITGVTAEWDGTHNGNAEITGSLILSGSSVSLNVDGQITASGNISSSGVIYVTDIYDDSVNINTIYSPIAGGTGIETVGTIGTGTWNGTAINQTYLVGQSGTNTGDQNLSNLAVTGSSTNFAEITASGDVSSSATSTASFGTYLGDGSQLSGITSGYWTGSSAKVTIEQTVEVSASMTFISGRGVFAESAFGNIAVDPTALIETRAVKTHTTLEPVAGAITSLSQSGAYGGSIVVYDGGNQTGNMIYSLPANPTYGMKYTIVSNGPSSTRYVQFRSNSANIHGFISSPDNAVNGVFTAGVGVTDVQFPATRFLKGDWVSFTSIRTYAGGGVTWAMDGCAYKANTIVLT